MTAAQRLEDVRAASPWMTPAEVAVYARRAVSEVKEALRTGALVGHQRVKGGRWTVHRDAVDAYVRGDKYTPPAPPVVTRRGGR